MTSHKASMWTPFCCVCRLSHFVGPMWMPMCVQLLPVHAVPTHLPRRGNSVQRRSLARCVSRWRIASSGDWIYYTISCKWLNSLLSSCLCRRSGLLQITLWGTAAIGSVRSHKFVSSSKLYWGRGLLKLMHSSCIYVTKCKNVKFLQIMCVI